MEQFFSTMNRQFTEKEWLQIKAPPTEEQQLALFYRHWVMVIIYQFILLSFSVSKRVISRL